MSQSSSVSTVRRRNGGASRKKRWRLRLRRGDRARSWRQCNQVLPVAQALSRRRLDPATASTTDPGSRCRCFEPRRETSRVGFRCHHTSRWAKCGCAWKGRSTPSVSHHPGATRSMISLLTGTNIWIAAGVTDMRRGFTGLSATAQTVLEQNRTPATSSSSGAGARSHQSSLVDGDGSACSPSVWSAAVSSGPKRTRVWCR